MFLLILAALSIVAPIAEQHEAQYLADRQTDIGQACYQQVKPRTSDPLTMMVDERNRFYHCYEGARKP